MLIQLSRSRPPHPDGLPAHQWATALAPPVSAGVAVDFGAALMSVNGAPAAPAVAAELPPAPLMPQGGFLAELEREVSSRPPQDGPDRETLARNARLANLACRAVTDYWTQLAEHLNALQPVSGGRFVFDGRTVLERLPTHGYRVLPKMRVAHTGEEQFEAVMLCWRVGTRDRLRLVKEFPAEIDKLKSRLAYGSINAHESQARDPASGRHRGLQFEFITEFNASVCVTPLHDSGMVRLTLLNLEAFERVEAELPAFAMRPHELDELARWICGRPNGLLKHARNIVRHEP